MPPRTSRRLVIDASVARASGDENAVYPTSKRCRDFLSATLDICHQAVMTTEMRDEWNRHQSGFARRWRVSMVARRKLYLADLTPDNEFRSKIERAAVKGKDKKALLKDIHLVEAAMATDRVIISLDEAVRALLGKAAPKVGELRIIIWANPDKTEEECIIWLESGAKTERKRQIGFAD